VLNTGISTVAPLAETKKLLENEDLIMEFSDLRQMAVAERKAVQQQPHGTHADEIETSMMLYIAPHTVHLDLARPELSPDRPGPLTRDPATAGVYSPTGA
jgi:creatinine amidohydrolase